MTAITQRSHRSRGNDLAGRAAEVNVARLYSSRGNPVLAERWRGASGEIDLIVEDGDCVVFVEVKKSRNHAQAAQALSRRQMGRIARTAEEYLGTTAGNALRPARFDLAMVDGQGRIALLENIFLDAA